MSEFCYEQNSRTVKRIVIGPFDLTLLENGKRDTSRALLLVKNRGVWF